MITQFNPKNIAKNHGTRIETFNIIDSMSNLLINNLYSKDDSLYSGELILDMQSCNTKTRGDYWNCYCIVDYEKRNHYITYLPSKTDFSRGAIYKYIDNDLIMTRYYDKNNNIDEYALFEIRKDPIHNEIVHRKFITNDIDIIKSYEENPNIYKRYYNNINE